MTPRWARIFTPLVLPLAFLPALALTTPREEARDEFSPLFERRLALGQASLDKPGDRLFAARIVRRDAEIILSANPVSFCIGSVCAGSICLGSACLGSYCGGSGCLGSSCGGSACNNSTCGGSVCVGSTCLASVCARSICLGSACGRCSAEAPENVKG